MDGVSVVNWPIRRLILSYGANMYSRIVTGMPINDGTGGFKAWRSSTLEKIQLKKVRSQGYSFQIEMNFRAWRRDARIKEEPIIFFDRTVGESKCHLLLCMKQFGWYGVFVFGKFLVGYK